MAGISRFEKGVLALTAGFVLFTGGWFLAGWVCALCCVWHHYRLIRNREREGCFRAFLHNNWLGAFLFAGVVLDYAMR